MLNVLTLSFSLTLARMVPMSLENNWVISPPVSRATRIAVVKRFNSSDGMRLFKLSNDSSSGMPILFSRKIKPNSWLIG